MKIIVVPETPEEIKSREIVEHVGVEDFFLFGIKNDEDGRSEEFHEWRGGYKYLIGSLAYFGEILNDERRRVPRVPKIANKQETLNFGEGFIKKGEVLEQKLEIIDAEEDETAVETEIENEKNE